MAKSASEKNIAREESGPDYAATIKLIRGQLRSNDSEQRSLAQDNGEAYKRIEKDYGVHKGAAKQFAAIDKMAPEKRTDFLRSLLGLLRNAGYDNFDDLVDRAQAPAEKPTAPRKPKPAPGATDVEPPADDSSDLADAERVNLKTGWIQRVKDASAGKVALVDEDWEDVRQATSDELAAERSRLADFDDGVADNVHPLQPRK